MHIRNMCIFSSSPKHKFLFSTCDYSSQLEICIASDCLGVTRKLGNLSTVEIMSAKLHLIVREFLILKLKRLNSLKFIKVDAHQDDNKSFEQLTLFEKINVEYYSRSKRLIANTS